MGRIQLIFILLLVTLIFVPGCDKEGSDDHFIKGPYLQNVTLDAITIMWESKDAVIGRVFYGIVDKQPTEIAEDNTTTIHEITLRGLATQTIYNYKVVSGINHSSLAHFKTAADPKTPFSFAVYGDNKNGPAKHETIANLMLSKNPDFVLQNGDLVDRGNVSKQWNLLFFNPAKKLMSSVPLFPVIGNHEDHADNFFNYFSLPNNEMWYSFEYGNAHFIVLDSDRELLRAGSEQLKWLESDLKRNRSTWTFVNFHHPPFTSGGNYYKKSRIAIKNLLHPVFEKYRVDMVFNGHDHHYERSYPIVSKKGDNPITYVVCGNGGTPLRYIGSREWTCYSERVFGFVKLDIDGTKLEFKSFNIEDQIIDQFTYDKSSSKSIADYQQHLVYFENINDPVLATRLYGKGDDCWDENKYAEALRLFEKAYFADTTCIKALSGVAKCYLRLGNLEKAQEFALKSFHKKQNLPESYKVLVNVFRKKKQYDQALEWCDKWFQIAPDDSNPNETRSEIYEEQGKINAALVEMNRALSILPSDADLYFNLAKLYEKNNDRENALKSYKNGIYWFMEKRDSKEYLLAKKKIKDLSE